MKTRFTLALCLLCCAGLQAQDAWLDSNIAVLLPYAALPPDALKAGGFEVRLQGAAQMESSYRRSVRAATQQARQAGANLISIRSMKPPGPTRAGWELSGMLYKTADFAGVTAALQRRRDSVLQTAAAAARGEAVLVCYRNYDKSKVRPPAWVGDSAIGSLRVGDVVILRIPAGRETRITAGKAGMHHVTVTGKAGEVLFVKVQVSVVPDNTLLVQGNAMGINLPDIHAQVTLSEPRIGWEEAQALLER